MRKELIYLDEGVVGRAQRKGPRLNKREYLDINVVCRRRSHVTLIDIFLSIISFTNLTFLSLLRDKHTSDRTTRIKLSSEIFIYIFFHSWQFVGLIHCKIEELNYTGLIFAEINFFIYIRSIIQRFPF